MNTVPPGVILGISRGVYDHYGVYIGNDEVIHFTSLTSDVSGDNKVMKTKMSHFLRESDSFWVMSFPDNEEFKNMVMKKLIKEFAISLAKRSPLLLAAAVVPFVNIFAGINTAIEMNSYRDKIVDLIRSLNYNFHSKEETVFRAKSRLGSTEYNLVFNNCEHFAIWCKTDLSVSSQADRATLLKITSYFEKSRTISSSNYIPL